MGLKRAHLKPAAAAIAAADLVFSDIMTVVLANATAPVLSVVKVFPVLALLAALVAAVCGDSARYGSCGLARWLPPSSHAPLCCTLRSPRSSCIW